MVGFLSMAKTAVNSNGSAYHNDRMLDIRASTDSFEQQLIAQTDTVRMDLVRKHELMRTSAFVFLRATFYRWIETFAEACGAAVADAPRVLAVGDVHVENFGTWRDAEGRLVWGINDVDEAAELPYVNDLVRLATSAALAADEDHLSMTMREICASILDGYLTSLRARGRPIVLADRRRWLRRVALSDLRDPVTFWPTIRKRRRRDGTRRPPPDAVAAIDAAMPQRDLEYEIHPRSAGVGSLGRQRYVAIADWNGGFIAREAKALVGPADPMRRLLANAVRAHDPMWTIHGSWIVRRLAPDCSKIEIADLPQERNEKKLLRAMGWETANLHLATPRAAVAVVKDLRGRGDRWLERAAEKMRESTLDDWRDWRRGDGARGVKRSAVARLKARAPAEQGLRRRRRG